MNESWHMCCPSTSHVTCVVYERVMSYVLCMNGSCHMCVCMVHVVSINEIWHMCCASTSHGHMCCASTSHGHMCCASTSQGTRDVYLWVIGICVVHRRVMSHVLCTNKSWYTWYLSKRHCTYLVYQRVMGICVVYQRVMAHVLCINETWYMCYHWQFRWLCSSGFPPPVALSIYRIQENN